MATSRSRNSASAASGSAAAAATNSGCPGSRVWITSLPRAPTTRAARARSAATSRGAVRRGAPRSRSTSQKMTVSAVSMRRSTASVPTKSPPVRPSRGLSAVTSIGLLPVERSICEHRPVVPALSVRSDVRPHSPHIAGRVDAHLSHVRPSCVSARSARHSEHFCSAAHVEHASNRARPFVFRSARVTEETSRAAARRALPSKVPETSSRERSSISTRGHPLDVVATPWDPGQRTSESADGTGDVHTTGMLMRRARSTATLVASQEGLRSSLSVSSCSSITTIVDTPGHGANTVERAPITTSAPTAAVSQSSGRHATPSPRRRSAAAPSRAMRCVGHTTKTGPLVAAANTAVNADAAGGIRTNPPPRSRTSRTAAPIGSVGSAGFVPCRGCATPALIFGDDADARTARNGPHHRSATHRHRSTTSGSTPRPLRETIGRRSAYSRPPDGAGDSATTQPPTRRPFRSTRTRSPTCTPRTAGGTA